MPLDALMLLGAGLAMSLGHCLGMCGPLVGSLAAAQQSRGLRTGGVLVAQLLHHLGRITSYALIGLVLAAVGSTVRLAGLGRGLAGTLSPLLALGTERLSPRLRRGFNRLAAVLVLLIGIQLICRGAAAMGWIGHLRFGEVVIW